MELLHCYVRDQSLVQLLLFVRNPYVYCKKYNEFLVKWFIGINFSTI